MEKVKFIDQQSSKFFKELRTAVDEYFKTTKQSKHANGHMVFKTIFFSVILIAAYYILVFSGVEQVYGDWIVYPLWVIIGLFSAFSAVNIGHDAIHGAYSKQTKINALMSHSFNLLGASAYMWKLMHNQAHHTFTNIDHHDEDIIAVPIIRMASNQLWKPIHRYQHIFCWFLYPLGTLSWVFKKDYSKFYQKSIGTFPLKHKAKDHVMLYVYKGIYYCLFIALPLMMVDVPVTTMLLGFLIGHLFEGFALAVIFMLAHVVEEVEFPMYNEENVIQYGWHEHQMRTTANFATGSYLVNFLTGGLNFQIEHHLFPLVCHTHYPKLSPIVKEVASKYRIPYHNTPTYLGAIRSHYRHLKKMGRA